MSANRRVAFNDPTAKKALADFKGPSFDDLAAIAAEEPDPEGWKDFALCAEVDPELWFPEKGGSTREAKKICRECPVRAQCLEYALDTNQNFGIWGATSERERRRIRAERDRARVAAQMGAAA